MIDDYEPSLRRAADEGARFVAEVAAGAPPRWLTFSGPCGSGKTFLSHQIFAEAAKHNPGNASLWLAGTNEYRERSRRPRCVWMTEADFAARLRGGEYDLPDYLARDFLVAIDDLGATRDPSAFVADALGKLANLRLGKWTLFTTNLSLPEISERMDERIASRLVRPPGNRLVRITAHDYALQPPKKPAA